MTRPLKWESVQLDDWYFEEQHDGIHWIEYKNKIISDNFTLISAKKDENGYPVVLIKKTSGFIFLRLTQYASYWNIDPSIVTQNVLVLGEWAKKNGKFKITTRMKKITLLILFFSFKIDKKTINKCKEKTSVSIEIASFKSIYYFVGFKSIILLE